MLPPADTDMFKLAESGTLLIGKEEELMSGEGVGILEMLKLERTPDLRKIVAPEKGSVRGRNSDDIARCMVGANVIVKDSVVSNFGHTGRRRDILKKLQSSSSKLKPIVFNPNRYR